MNIAAKYLLTTEVSFKKEDRPQLIQIWRKTLPENANIYLSKNDNSLLELRTVEDLIQLKKLLNEDFSQLKANTKILLQSDFRQNLLSFVEDVIPQITKLPMGDYLQMRYIEVPLCVYDDYKHWRNETIFKHVRNLKNIDSFVAYHSLLSAKPGVMFISSFSGDPEKYLSGFNNPAYQEIVRQAGDRFITGGNNGLYTTMYQKL